MAEKMTEADFATLVSAEIRDGLSYIDGDIAVRRERYLNYYMGDVTDLPRQAGRSEVTDRALADNINLMLPSLMRVFTGSRYIGEFESADPSLDDMVTEVTEYIDHVIKKDNRGEVMIYQWGWDALVQIVGTVKAYWEEDIDHDDETVEALDDMGLAGIIQQVEADEALEITAHSENVEELQTFDDFGGPVMTRNVTHDVTVRRTINKSKIVVENVPPEELVVSRDARSMEDSRLVSHRSTKTVSELIEMGFDRELVESLPDRSTSSLEQARSSAGAYQSQAQSLDPMSREVVVHQGVMRCDYDGDGIKEWYFTIGGDDAAVEVFECVEYDYQVIFADFCPNPLPHMFFGRCPADDLAEVMKVKTAITRQVLDNLYLSNTPQREVVFNNLLNPDSMNIHAPGAPIYVKQPGTVREIAVPFVAQHGLTMLQHFDGVAEARTGVSRASMGLDPAALTNQSATAANIAQSAAHGKTEMIARLWAQTGMRKLFMGLFNIAKRYQDFSRVIRVGGVNKAVDPRQWEALGEADVTIRTGLGTGTRERDLAMLGAVAAKQEQILLQMGPGNPAVGLGHYIQTCRKMVEAAGMTDLDSFFADVPLDWRPPEQQQQPPDPKMIEAEAKMNLEQQKMQMAVVGDQKRAENDLIMAREKAQNEMTIAREKAEMQAQIDRLKAQYGREVELEKLQLQRDLKMEELSAEAELEGLKMAAGSRDGQGNIPQVME